MRPVRDVCDGREDRGRLLGSPVLSVARWESILGGVSFGYGRALGQGSRVFAVLDEVAHRLLLRSPIKLLNIIKLSLGQVTCCVRYLNMNLDANQAGTSRPQPAHDPPSSLR